MGSKKCMGISGFTLILPVLLFALRIHCAAAGTILEQTVEVPLQERIRLAAETGEISLLEHLIDQITDKTAEVLLSAFNASCKAKRPEVLKCLLGRAEFPARDFSKGSDSDLYSLLNDSQDEELLRLMLKKGAVKHHHEIVPAIHSVDLAAELKLESREMGMNRLNTLCFVKSPEVAQYLIDHGCSPKDGYLPTSPLAWVDRVDVAEVLIRNGAEFNFQQPPPYVRTREALCWRQWDDQLLPHVKTREIAELLIKRGCGYNFPDSFGSYAIHCERITPPVLGLLLELGLSPNLPDADGLAPLFHFTDSAEKARILLEQGADPKLRAPLKASPDGKITEKSGYTLLHLARTGDFARLMLESGLDPDVRGGEFDETPLHKVTDLDALKALVEAGADLNARDSFGNTPIFNRNLNHAGLKYLIEHRADPEALNLKGIGVREMHPDTYCQDYLKSICKEVALPFSRNLSLTQNPLAFQEAVDKGASILEPFDFSTEKDRQLRENDGELPLVALLANRQCNVKEGNNIYEDKVYLDLIRKYLDQGGNPRVTDRYGRNLLMLCPRLEVYRMLEKKGFDFGNYIHWMLDPAVEECGNVEMIRFLLEKGGPGLKDEKCVDRWGKSSKIDSLRNCRLEYMDLLIKAGFYPDATYDTVTPLHLAAYMSHLPDDLQKAEKLIAAGADTNLADRFGHTPLHFVAMFFYMQLSYYQAPSDYLADNAILMLKALLAGGANPLLKDKDGYTALELLKKRLSEKHIPEEGKLLEMMKLLE
ncbi:MAG: hypothetical protein PHW04_12505 [Candidatus Wallbacteria bacterium]|nr:hypothetical protein [Candidatus Wallbacteria bacterium]